MTATIGDWEKAMKRMPTSELNEFKEHLVELKKFPMFEKEFKWTCIFLLIALADEELTRREKKEEAVRCQ